MNRIDRLFATMLLLQNKQRVRAEDLAERFAISKRTVYRDVAALHEMGVPIVSLPGEGYELMPGYYLPPLLFTPDEAGALFLAANMLIQQAEGQTAQDVATGLAKITAVLPPQTRQEAEHPGQNHPLYCPGRPFQPRRSPSSYLTASHHRTARCATALSQLQPKRDDGAHRRTAPPVLRQWRLVFQRLLPFTRRLAGVSFGPGG